MKKFTLLCCCLLVTAITFAQNEFITTWQTTTSGENITIPTTGTGYSYTVDWGDASTPTAQTGNATHTYATVGTYTVKITGTFPRIYFNNTGDKLKIKTIAQWGTNLWTSMNSAFKGCANLTSTATDVPNLSSVTDMSNMFYKATVFNGNISNWNVSSVTNMYAMFYQAAAFNGNISTWNVSSVTNMRYMFALATAFNQNISSWNVSSVIDMSNMFNGATAFNQNLNTWNVSSVTNMFGMFYQAAAFNGNISTWNVSSVTDMRYMFALATAFNQNIGSWNVSSVIDMSNMFDKATAFNQNLGAWDISSVTSMGYMFNGDTLSTANYDNTLIGWSTLSTGETKIPTGIIFDGGNSKYTNIGKTGRDLLTGTYNWTITDGGLDTTAFITTWQTTTSNESITIPTTGTGYSYTVDWGDGNTTAQTGNATHSYATASTYTVKITGTFPRIYFNFSSDRLKIKTIEQWGTNVWSSMNKAFYGCSNLTSNATAAPNLSNVTDLSYMFNNASIFNQNIGNWDVSNVTNMNGMFGSATAFNQDISTWNTAAVTNMSGMFSYATAFNQNISTWNTAAVTNLNAIFLGASNFNQNIGNWDVSKVTNMSLMFDNATAFNQDISTWNTAAVTDMNSMFTYAIAFNQNISAWNTAAVTDMSFMFSNATSFNQDISAWNTAAVTNMVAMFDFTTSFNQNIGNWAVSNVTNMNGMFAGATAFNQNLGAWDISSVTNMSNMFNGDTLSTANYDNTLIGWRTFSAGETQIPTGITFSGGNSKFCAGQTAKNTLIGTFNWTITDGGLDANCTLAVNDYNLVNSIKLYPNPSTNMINLTGNISKLQKVSIYSLLGRRVMSINKNFKAINIEALNTGIYFVKLVTNKGVKTVELVKE